MTKKTRCDWCLKDEIYIEYHDKEWGKPLHDDAKLFEFFILGVAQAGLSWITVLRKRENYRQAFDYFNAKKMAKYKEEKIAELLKNEGIIRNKAKIAAAIHNARLFLLIQKEFGSFDKYIWQFTKHKAIINNPKTLKDIPATSPESDAMSKDLKSRGFKFMGSTICYAFMQTVGIVNDHLVSCYKK